MGLIHSYVDICREVYPVERGGVFEEENHGSESKS